MAYLDASESQHESTVTLFDAAQNKVTTHYALAEFVALAKPWLT